jgi:diacylglycerol kinase
MSKPSAHDPTPPSSKEPQRPSFVPDPRERFFYSRWVSFRVGVAGALYTLRTQSNAWIEVTALAVVVVVSVWLRISAVEWAIISLVIGLVLALEAVNTAIEAVVDLVSPDWHPQAKVAKDAAAGALVFAVLSSLGVAAAIFGPRLWALFF